MRQSLLPGMEEQPATNVPWGDGGPAAAGAALSHPTEVSHPTAFSHASLAGKTVWVIDAHSLIFQVFHAIAEMSSPQGLPVNAVFGFTRDVLFLIEEKKPDFLFVAFDMPGLTFRHDLFADYKKDRAEMPDELPAQIELIERVLSAMSVPVVGLEGYEADDVLATIARLAEEEGGKCFLVTTDKDCRQLISDRVQLYNPRKNLFYDKLALERDWGIRPEQVVDFQALVGDSIDGVPGVRGIGPKTAQDLLKQFGTLDAALEQPESINKARIQQLIKTQREQALLSRTLVRLDRHVPLALDWPAGDVSRFDVGGALDLFIELGFRTFADKAREYVAKRAAPAQWHADYRSVTSVDELHALAARMSHQPCISIDTETTHFWPRWAELVGLSFAWAEGEAYYVPVRAPAGEPSLPLEAVLDALRPVLEDPGIEKIGQNLKYDVQVLRAAGVELAGPRFDALVASYLVNAGQRSHGLDELAKKYLNHQNIKISDLIGSGKNQKRMDEVPLEQITRYAGEDADVPLRLRPILQRLLAEAHLDELYKSVEIPLLDVLADMEYVGIKVDRQRLAELSREYQQRMDELAAEIYRLAGREFNIASPKQLQQVLFQELKLPVQRRTRVSGPSTDADVLEELARDHELPAKILEYRQYAKLKGTYVDALPEMIHPQTGRVHTSFNQDVAATGRLSSSDPNLQNIPIRTQTGRDIRSAFLPGETGWKLLAADYSQIELRILAHFSGDATLRAAFERDEDIHTRVASEVYGVPAEAVTSEMRRNAKVVNFGIIYGLSPFGLARQLGIDKTQAAEFIEAYFARYPGVEEFLAETLAQCAARGYVSTIMGRRRAIRGVRPGDSHHRARRQRNLPERTAVNTVIQGSAADLIKLAMITIHRRLLQERLSARMLLQIHDELIFESPVEEISPLANLVVKEMSSCLPLRVPLKIDVAVGGNWADLESHHMETQTAEPWAGDPDLTWQTNP
jgi:DNA polymerase-1